MHKILVSSWLYEEYRKYGFNMNQFQIIEPMTEIAYKKVDKKHYMKFQAVKKKK